MDTLFPLEEIPVVPVYSAGMNAMLKLYGRTEGKLCRSCVHFTKQGGVAGTYYKCKLNRITSGPGTDWRARYPACGKWEPAHQGQGEGNAK